MGDRKKLELIQLLGNSYKVVRAHNLTSPRIGEILAKKSVDELIRIEFIDVVISPPPKKK